MPGTLLPDTGGGKRIRTADPLLAKQVLFQLSYTPMIRHLPAIPSWPVVGLGRVELPTSPLSGVRSSQLSYRPIPQPNRRVFSP